MITYFKDKNKSKNKNRNYRTITTILKSFDTLVIITTTSSSITLSLTGNGLVAIPIPIATACGLSIGSKVLFGIIINNYNNYKELYEEDQLVFKSFDKLYRKSLQDNKNDNTELESLCNFFTKYVDEVENECFL